MKTVNFQGKQDKQDTDDDYDDELEIMNDKRQSNASLGDRSRIDYDIDIKFKDHETPSLILYKYRWVVLFAYFLTSTATGAV